MPPIRKWTRTPPTDDECRRVLVWPEGQDPEPVSRDERAGLPADAQVTGWRVDVTSGDIAKGWYGPTTTSFGTQSGVWYRSAADAVLAVRRQVLRRAGIELIYLERILAHAEDSQNPHETP